MYSSSGSGRFYDTSKARTPCSLLSVRLSSPSSPQTTTLPLWTYACHQKNKSTQTHMHACCAQCQERPRRSWTSACVVLVFCEETSFQRTTPCGILPAMGVTLGALVGAARAEKLRRVHFANRVTCLVSVSPVTRVWRVVVIDNDGGGHETYARPKYENADRHNILYHCTISCNARHPTRDIEVGHIPV